MSNVGQTDVLGIMRLVCKARWSALHITRISILIMFQRKFVEKRDSRPDSSVVKRDSNRFSQWVSRLVGTTWSPSTCGVCKTKWNEIAARVLEF